ncbi:MBL fold metallo-hydrolase [Peribacillus sp. NPDC097264]|uniref:MBL fold metallo-hydrolase n=1 Tax=Peribacillus sp. NPDC097264 TaxID=3390616 RepID=UPI003D048979
MIRKLMDHIYEIKLPSVYNADVNCYLIEHETSYMLIDTGENNEETKAFWGDLIPTLHKPISHILLTHIHTDHAGCCHFLRQHAAVKKIIASTKSEEKLATMKNSPKNVGLIETAKQYGYTYPYSPKHLLDEHESYNFEIDETFDDDEIIHIGSSLFQAIATPGHSVDHFCFYEQKRKVLFAGDQLIQNFSPVLIVENNQFNPLKNYLHSLNKIKNFSCQLTVSGHGDIIANTTDLIESLEMRHFKKLTQLKNALKQQPYLFDQIIQLFYKKDVTKPSPQIMQTLGYLNYLLEEGSLKIINNETKITMQTIQ